MKTSLRSALFLGLLVTGVGCGDALSPAWRVESFRIFAAKIENLSRPSDPSVAEVAPGEEVRIRMFTGDVQPTPAPLSIAWVFCPSVQRTGNSVGCSPQNVILPTINGADATFTLRGDIPFTRDPQNRSRLQGVGIACSNGTIALDPATMLPRCDGPMAQGWTLSRTLIVRLAETVPANRNPKITGVFVVGGGTETPLDAMQPLRVPRCTSEPCAERVIEVRVSDDSREQYASFDTFGTPTTVTERIVFGYFTTRGTLINAFRTDTAERPMGPIQNTWTVPREAGEVRFHFTAQDPRGGVDYAERTIVVE